MGLFLFASFVLSFDACSCPFSLFSLFFSFLSCAKKREEKRQGTYENDWPCRKSDTHRAHCYCYFRYWNRLFLSILFYFIPQHFCLLVCSRSVHRSLRIINVWRSHIYIYISFRITFPIPLFLVFRFISGKSIVYLNTLLLLLFPFQRQLINLKKKKKFVSSRDPRNDEKITSNRSFSKEVE